MVVIPEFLMTFRDGCFSLVGVATVAFAWACAIDDRQPSLGDSGTASALGGAGGGESPGGAGSGGEPCDASERPCAGANVTCGPGGAAECTGVCAGCVISDSCIASGAVHPEDDCLVCDPSRAKTAWSSADGGRCDDGLFCTVDDACSRGACTGSPRQCDDGVACNGISSCDESSDRCSPAEKQCTGGDVCDVDSGECASTCDGCLINEVCFASGGTDPSNPCQVCDPSRSSTAFSPKGEGAFCGSGEQCSAASICRFTGIGLVSAGFWDTCVIREGGVYCVGAGGPIDLGADATAFQISTGQHHTCALLSNGSVRCWGDALGSDRGQLGTTSIQSAGGEILIGTVQLGARAVSISAGTDSNCAVIETGAVRCWGVNAGGQLGYGHTQNIGDDAADFPFADVDLGGERAIQVDTGNNHTCAVLEGGAVRCWGRGFGGALGYGSDADLLAPPGADVDIGARVVQVATGSAHTCAVLAGNFLRCWGYNDAGQLGYGHTHSIGDDETPAEAENLTVPRDPAVPNGPTRPLGGHVDLSGVVAQVQIRQGLRDGSKTCVRLLGGGVRCWGSAAFGGLGYAHQSNIGDNETPVEAEMLVGRINGDGTPVPLGGNLAFGGAATALAEGGDQCALRADGEVLCWRSVLQTPTLVEF